MVNKNIKNRLIWSPCHEQSLCHFNGTTYFSFVIKHNGEGEEVICFVDEIKLGFELMPFISSIICIIHKK